MKASRRAVVASAAIALTVALGACSSPAGGEGGASAAPTDESATITYAIWDENQKAGIEQNIADFNKTYPNIKVNVDITPWAQYWTKLQTQAEGKNLPDIFWMNGPNIQYYAANDQLEPLTALEESGQFDPANYPEALGELYTWEDVPYGIPKDFDTIALWYNKAIFAEAGVELPTESWTWDDFTKAANDITAALKDKGIYGVVANLGSGQQTYYNTMFQAGGYVISDDKKSSGFDEPTSVEGLQFWADLMASGASPTIEQVSDTPANKWFGSGKAAMYWSGTWMVSELSESAVKDDIDVIDLPSGPAGKATIIHGLANVVAKDSKNKDAAMAFLAYLGTEEAQRTQAEMKAANPAFNGTQQAFVDSQPEWNLQVFEDAATEYAKPYPISKNSQAWASLEPDLLLPGFGGEIPIGDAAADLATQMNALLAEE